MLKLKFTLELDEEQLRELFEGRDIKFSKKKVSELSKEMKENLDSVQMDLEERFEEIVEEWIDSQFS